MILKFEGVIDYDERRKEYEKLYCFSDCYYHRGICNFYVKMSEAFTNLLPSIGVILGFGLSFYFVSLALKTIPLSIGYAIWSGVGTVLTALIGVLVWDEHFNVFIFGVS